MRVGLKGGRCATPKGSPSAEVRCGVRAVPLVVAALTAEWWLEVMLKTVIRGEI
jgi:hypothetical protein